MSRTVTIPALLAALSVCASAGPGRAEAAEPLKTLHVSSPYMSLSKVKNYPAKEGAVVVSNTGTEAVAWSAVVGGRDAGAFLVDFAVASERRALLAPGEHATLRITFQPTGPAGLYQAELQIGPRAGGVVVALEAVALEAFEGENEPPLARIVMALGIPVNVGGEALRLETKTPSIGSGVAAITLRKAEPGPVQMTPVARFSPPGAYPFGWYPAPGTEETVVGTLSDSATLPDAHQRLFPPLADGQAAASFDPGEGAFGLFLRTVKKPVALDPARQKSLVAHSVRLFPIAMFQGRPVKNALLVCFEEAANGDYQDAVFVLENVTPIVEAAAQ